MPSTIDEWRIREERRKKEERDERNRLRRERRKRKSEPPPATLGTMADQYVALRNAGVALEVCLEDPTLSEADLKRLDKAVTVMKTGFKIAKKVLKGHGVRFERQSAAAPVSEPTTTVSAHIH